VARGASDAVRERSDFPFSEIAFPASEIAPPRASKSEPSGNVFPDWAGSEIPQCPGEFPFSGS